MLERLPHKVLVVGSGGREHALGEKLNQSPNVSELYFAPGNGGTQELGTNVDIGDTEVKRLVRFVKDKGIGMTVIGPEASLNAGLSDALREADQDVFGPSRAAAQLETSKAFAAEFLKAHDIPHPETWVFTDPDEAIAHAKRMDEPFVIKASGLAAGKGVFLPDTLDEAAEKIKAISQGKVSNITGDKILIQRRLHGREASIIAISDGKTIVPFIPAQDYKRAYDKDKGPNTGGMGSFAPSSIDPELLAEIRNAILQPTVDGMAAHDMPYKGVLYAGLMLTDSGPQVIEFNARFGDPETQPLMTMLDSDILPIMQASVRENLSADHIRFRDGAAVCVVLAEKGYPGEYQKGHEIHGLDVVQRMQDIRVFHAGTRREGNRIVTAGGRVLGVTAYGADLEKAATRAYSVIGKHGVWFEGMEWRRDIGR